MANENIAEWSARRKTAASLPLITIHYTLFAMIFVCSFEVVHERSSYSIKTLEEKSPAFILRIIVQYEKAKHQTQYRCVM